MKDPKETAVKKSKEKKDGLGDMIDPNADYYVQDARSFVDNCILWWGLNSRGYVCELDRAGIYKGSEAPSMRPTDVFWPTAIVLANTVTHVRSEGLYRAIDARKKERGDE